MIETTINDAVTMRDEAAGNAGRLRPGDEILGRYVVESELGQGGMGVVYKCLDKVGGVEVAVKGLPPEVSHNADEMEEIRDNYSLVEGLRHPNICGIKTLEKDARGDYYLVMDLAHGMNLNRWLRQHPEATDAEKLAILKQIASALDYAHEMKIIHRDVKPENVMVDDAGKVLVLDFGLAAQIRSSLSRTSRAVISTSGTPGYKAPEQWRGQPQGPAADQYALGVLAYRLFAGRLPFEGDDLVILGQAVLNEPVQNISTASSAVNAALGKALAKRPEARFPSCRAFIGALEGGPRSRAAVPRIALVAVLFLAAIGGWWWHDRQETVLAQQVESPKGSSEADTKYTPGQTPPKNESKNDASKTRNFAVATLDEAKRHRDAARWQDSLAAAEKVLGWEPENAEAKALKAEAESNILKEVRKPQAGEEKEIELPGGVKMKFVWCPSGTFTMGSPTDEKGLEGYETQHQVTLTKGFWLGQYEVTQAQWRSVMGNNPSTFTGDDNRPVENVSWEDCQKFVEKCNEAAKNIRFALPTEAQWEYACRAGSTGPYAGTGDIDAMGWHDGNSESQTHPVAQKQSNAWNLYDMHGNVNEWCADWFGKYEGDGTDPIGGVSGGRRVLRGGSWLSHAGFCRSASRCGGRPDDRGFRNYGFRLLCSKEPNEVQRMEKGGTESTDLERNVSSEMGKSEPNDTILNVKETAFDKSDTWFDSNVRYKLNTKVDFAPIYFKGKAIDTHSEAKIGAVAMRLKQNPSEVILLVGHYDDSSSSDFNLSSSVACAECVKNRIVEMGVSCQRIQTRGVGDTRPAVSGSKGQLQNNRVEIMIYSTEMDNLPEVTNVGKFVKGDRVTVNGRSCVVKDIVETGKSRFRHMWCETERRHFFLGEDSVERPFKPKTFAGLNMNITSESGVDELSALDPCDVVYFMFKSAFNKDADLASKLGCTVAFRILKPEDLKAQYLPYCSTENIPTIGDDVLKNSIVGMWIFDQEHAAVWVNSFLGDKTETSVFYVRRIGGNWRCALFPD